MEEREWSAEWPTKPGWYWFFGYLYGGETREYAPVQVFKVSNGVVRTVNGNFMYRSEGHLGLFIPAIVPSPPTEMMEEIDGQH